MGAGMSGMPLPRNATSQMQFPAQQHPHMLQGDIASMASAFSNAQAGARKHPSGTALSAAPRLRKALLLHQTSALACD